MATIRTRVESLEQHAGESGGPQLDFTGLDPQERAELRPILEGVAAGTLTPDEARAMVERWQ